MVNREMKVWKKTCQELFNVTWKNKILNRNEEYSIQKFGKLARD